MAIVLASLAACRDEEFESATLEVHGVAEYATQKVSPLEYVTCSSDEVQIKAVDELDCSEVGTHEVGIELTKGDNTRTETVELRVRDTQPPTVRLNTELAELHLGDEFDAQSYVGSVKDPYDGELAALKKAPEAKGTKRGDEVFYDEGFYVAEGTVNTAKVGEYTVTYRAEDRHGNEASKELKVVVSDPLEDVVLTPTTEVLEYSYKMTDPTKLVSCSVEGAKVEADELSLAKVGTVEVAFTVTKGGSSHTVPVTFEVRDTKFPKVTLHADEVQVENGAVFDPYTNVASVMDEVDGTLARSDTKPADGKSGWYYITGDFDTSTAGKYFLTLQATDANGNQTTREFSVLVSAPPAAPEAADGAGSGGAAAGAAADDGGEGRMEVAAQSTSPAIDYVLNWNTMVFHYASCGHADRISPENRQDVHDSRENVIAQGFSPCGVCTP